MIFRLKELRKNKRISQVKLAIDLNMNQILSAVMKPVPDRPTIILIFY